MKKYLVIAVCMLLSVYSYAQGLYIKGGLGYNFPQAGQSFSPFGYPYNGSVTYNANNSTSYNYKNGVAFSSGLQGALGVGYMFTEHVGFELDLTAGLAQRKYTNKQISDSLIYSSTITANSAIFLAPQLVLQTGGKKFNFYARGGVALPLYLHLTETDVETNLPGNGAIENIVYTSDIQTSFALGFTGAMGVQYNLNDNVCIWGELNMLSMSLYVKEQDLTEATDNGVSFVSQFSPAQRTIQYSKNFTSINGSNLNTNNNNIVTVPSYSVPFSNIGIHAGIMYHFPKSSRSSGRSNGRSHSGARPSGNGRD